ncbi:B3 domain-containing protein Os07g0679700 isoform X2 [Beta vulgaris subsp. vulgaris]|uniref:B3 domain-containing protein Os07g0679700 isoform X2 n=1 Tax=Beta vulgaris subsp. vulgaris TaxID=3555 RepID=UPI0020371320|nr:B3 domain-containing protein Os07g0679700 isoform X2 [Beta vulgaris subsp. vulgaris]XP_048490106.1 B3 domain-containing protein Os07g0679700 isoform X2 [Beta vulgaris subsp. vulgaris]
MRTKRDGSFSDAQTSGKYSIAGDVQKSQLNSKLETNAIGNVNLLSMGNVIETNVPRYLPQSPHDLMNGSFGPIKPDAKSSSIGVGGLGFANISHSVSGPALHAQPNEDKPNTGVKDVQEPQMPSLNISLRSPSETPNFGLSFSGGVEEGENSRSTGLFQSGQRPRQILPKPPKNNLAKVSDTNKGSFSPMRVARPPAEGRLRNQLLPRYWPRITDQELQKLSGDLKTTIVPLFEKILSASDASRIGRLVLPKACAEAYFPTINQSEGLPLKIQDIKGNEWTFQFRFWPNNNSRMYVLEGVTPCIQSMQLQAGDTVTFSRIDPGGKLVIGYRKASNALESQDPQTSSANPNGAASGDSCYPDATDSVSARNGHCGLQSMAGAKDSELSALPEQSNLVNGSTVWGKSEKLKGKGREDVVEQPKLPSDKKRMRNIKSKRLLMHNDDAMELRLTWEETQDLLRPPPNVKPNIIMVEDFEFEEYSEPPVVGKRTFFTTQLSGGQEQWAQCDNCLKWRKLPADVLLPSKWTCSENIWDSSRSSCSSQEETSPKELDNVFKGSKDSKKRKVAESPEQGCEPSGLDALATAATLGDHEEPSAGATTRHPRHRPGCTCIVCIQPPSGKGKHKPSCVCNVCLTVKRRFKTLMMRKKKRQCEREAEMAQQKSNTEHQIKGSHQVIKKTSPNDIMSDKKDYVENEKVQEKSQPEEGESSSKGHIDLNAHPIREDDSNVDAQPSMGIMALAQAASAPLDNMYMKPNGLSNLLSKQPMDTDTCLLQKACDYVDRCLLPKDEHHSSVVNDQEQSKADGEASKKPTLD